MAEMRKALITGGAGFIGHHLIEHILKNTDLEIICLDRLDVSGNLNRLDEVISQDNLYKKRFKFIYHDLRAEINSQLAKQIGNPDLIFHLAASSHVDRSIQDPMGFVMDNVVGTVNLLNYARTIDNLEYLQNFSTDEVFGDAPEGTAYQEWDRHWPKNPYSASKSGAEAMGTSFACTYGLPVITTNCMNVIGERQHPEKFLPMCIKRVLNGQRIYIHTYPGRQKAGTRFYIHARNVADASLFLTENGYKGEKYNLVGQKEVSNLELAEFVAKVLDKPLDYEMVDFHSNRPGHDLRYALEDTKLCAMGYEYPTEFWYSLEKTIKWTIENQRWLVE